jgi:SAM-dependent methyltransferase
VEQSRKFPANASVIDLGCGPTGCYWQAVSPRAGSICLADYLEANLLEQRLWVDEAPQAFDWSAYTRLALHYEGALDLSPGQVAAREALARTKVTGYRHCDVSREFPLGEPVKFDVVMSFCVADSITAEVSAWEQYMRNIFSALKPGGQFIGATMRLCPQYHIDAMCYPSVSLDAEDVRRLMEGYGFDPASLRIQVCEESHPLDEHNIPLRLRQEYDEVVVMSGVLKG